MAVRMYRTSVVKHRWANKSCLGGGWEGEYFGGEWLMAPSPAMGRKWNGEDEALRCRTHSEGKMPRNFLAATPARAPARNERGTRKMIPMRFNALPARLSFFGSSFFRKFLFTCHLFWWLNPSPFLSRNLLLPRTGCTQRGWIHQFLNSRREHMFFHFDIHVFNFSLLTVFFTYLFIQKSKLKKKLTRTAELNHQQTAALFLPSAGVGGFRVLSAQMGNEVPRGVAALPHLHLLATPQRRTQPPPPPAGTVGCI